MLNKYEYFDLTCDGKLDNLVMPVCPARSSGEFNEIETMEIRAKTEGWTFPGKRHLCPVCSAKVVPVEEKAPRPARKPPAPAPVAELPGGQG